MKTMLRNFLILAIMAVALCGKVQAQYEIAVKSDSGQWKSGIWKTTPEITYGPNVSKLNYKDQNISGVGGNLICMKLVDTTGRLKNVCKWEGTYQDSTIFSVTSQIDSLFYYVLPEDTIYPIHIKAYYSFNCDSNTEIIVWSKFLPPTFEISEAKGENDLTLSDFGLVIGHINEASETAYYNKINWYCDNSLVYSGTDTILTPSTSGIYKVKVEVVYKTKFIKVNDTTYYKEFSHWVTSSDSVTVSTASIRQISGQKEFKVYPNPTTDYLYLPEIIDFSVFTLDGKEILKSKDVRIDVRDFNPGSYILRVKDRGIKFIVE